MTIEPCEIPYKSFMPMTPLTDDVLAVVGIYAVELDALRIQCGMPPYGQRRAFTGQQLSRGRSLGPTAMFTDADTFVVRLEQ